MVRSLTDGQQVRAVFNLVFELLTFAMRHHDASTGNGREMHKRPACRHDAQRAARSVRNWGRDSYCRNAIRKLDGLAACGRALCDRHGESDQISFRGRRWSCHAPRASRTDR
jgi:hypothetical protein